MTHTVLVVAAHPDDEVLGCGGTLARHAAEGDAVHVLFLADGATSRDDTGAPTADSRMAQARTAGDILGLSEVTGLALADNQLDRYPLLDIVRQVEDVVTRVCPDIVYTHHAGDLNVDHRIAHQATLTACRPIPGSTVTRILCFETASSTEWQSPGRDAFKPNVYTDIAPYRQIKARALEAYSDELRPPPHARSEAAISARETWLGHSVGLDAAEAFEAVRIILRASATPR